MEKEPRGTPGIPILHPGLCPLPHTGPLSLELPSPPLRISQLLFPKHLPPYAMHYVKKPHVRAGGHITKSMLLTRKLRLTEAQYCPVVQLLSGRDQYKPWQLGSKSQIWAPPTFLTSRHRAAFWKRDQNGACLLSWAIPSWLRGTGTLLHELCSQWPTPASVNLQRNSSMGRDRQGWDQLRDKPPRCGV